jgi:hypothetical protein
MEMKKVLFFVLLAIAFSCSKDEIDSPLVGHWEATSFTASEPIDDNGDGIKNTDLIKELECISMAIDFSSKGKVSIETTEVTYDFTSVDGNLVLTPKGCGPLTEKGTWNNNDASTQLFIDFIVEGSTETTSLTIDISVTENRLVLKDLIFEESPKRITYTVELKKTN